MSQLDVVLHHHYLLVALRTVPLSIEINSFYVEIHLFLLLPPVFVRLTLQHHLQSVLVLDQFLLVIAAAEHGEAIVQEHESHAVAKNVGREEDFLSLVVGLELLVSV